MANQIRIQANRRGAHSVTDSPETENQEIGFVSHTTPNPDRPAPAITHSSQMPSPGFGFVSHTTHLPSSLLPRSDPVALG